MPERILKELGFKHLKYLMNPGIYVLLLAGKVVYVGQTINIFGRFHSEDHRNRAYDDMYFIRCNLDELDRMEALMILKLKPEQNTTFNFNNNTDPRNRPTPSEAGQSTHTITVGGMALLLKGRRRI
jgi:hypothetical protein